MTIQERLFQVQDEKYKDFHSKLVPNIDKDTIIGVRVPIARKLAKSLLKEGSHYDFLKDLPHKYYDENILHGILISEEKDYQDCIKRVEAFLPYVDNWAVCDILSPKIFKKNRDRLIEKIKEWAVSSQVYTCRFGIGMLMSHFLEEDFKEEYLMIPAGIKSEEYYVNMMIAWFFATALAKQWDFTIPILTKNILDDWVHNKTIQKARESYRITTEEKAFLRTLKR